jgi:hypothetical protein
VLGWYAGEIIPETPYEVHSDYLMEMPLGCAAEARSSDLFANYVDVPGVHVMIDASRKGNWTRFINHSCEPYTEFRMRRVGNMRIMVVEAIRDIPEGVELSVNYGTGYYGVDTPRKCGCGSERCVSRLRMDGVEQKKEKKQRVKKCKRLVPPVEKGVIVTAI